MNKYTLLFICLFFFTCAYSQQVRPAASATIYKEIKMLKQLPRVLYIAAHPDDENTGLLSWLVNDQNVETAYLSLTRGDGGQNLIGSEQGAALGLIRTYELLEARKLDGAQQFFTRAIDFGFSKNPEDTFKQWDIDSITSDVVWVIRKFKPDLIICRFPPNSAAGHGQHSGSAIIAEKAFKAAADKNSFPDQLEHVGVWQAKRLLWNTFRFGSVNTTHDDQFKVTVGQYDPLLGMGYGELAGLSRSLHQSQGAGTPSVAGIRMEYFNSVAGSPIHSSLFDYIKQSWKDINNAGIDKAISKIVDDFDFLRPDLSLPALLRLRKDMRETGNRNLAKDKLADLDQIILSCAGFMGEAVTDKNEAMPGEQLDFRLNTIGRSLKPIVIKKINWLADEENVEIKLVSDSLYSLKKTVKIPENTPISEPYWLKDSPSSASLYDVKDKELIGLPINPPLLQVLLTLQIGNEEFEVPIPLSYKKLDPIKGDVVESLRIVPSVNIKFNQNLYFIKDPSNLKVAINLYANKSIVNGTLRIKNGDQIIFSRPSISLSNKIDTSLHILIPLEKLNFAVSDQLQAEFEIDNNIYTKDKHLIEYGHIPVLQYFNNASAKIIKDDLKIKITKVGYLQGAGDLVPDFLRLAGLQVTFLQESDFSDASKLVSYDAIITGVRVLNVERRMGKWMPILDQYVKNGGTLIMQFNTLQDLATTTYGPYPFTIGRGRVTEEDSEVRFLKPQHRILNYPHKITAADFKGWVQERGLYFPSIWDEHYEPLLEMHDTREQALKGATLYAKYGKGHYIYSSLSFFRQLPAGNVGAAKLFFNMLSIGK
jgi:LmbE family N-acetylglucosaminyl deacetylase